MRMSVSPFCGFNLLAGLSILSFSDFLRLDGNLFLFRMTGEMEKPAILVHRRLAEMISLGRV